MADLAISEGFNDNSLASTMARVNSIDVLQEPLLVSESKGISFVHERTGIACLKEMGLDQREGIVAYDEGMLKERFGDKELMTLEQYKADQHTLSDGRMDSLMNETTRSQFMYMDDRIDHIDKVMGDDGKILKLEPQSAECAL